MISVLAQTLAQALRDGGMNDRGASVFAAVAGDCEVPLKHNAPITIDAPYTAGATEASLNVYAPTVGGGEGNWGIAANFYGDVNIVGSVDALIPRWSGPIGTMIGFTGTSAALTAALAANPGWYLCNGSNGTIDMGEFFPLCFKSGGAVAGTMGATGGTSTHSHGTGVTGSTTVTISGTTGSSTDSVSGTTGSASGNTGSNTTGIAVPDHAASGCSVSPNGHGHTMTTTTRSDIATTGGAGVTVLTPPISTDSTSLTVNTPILTHSSITDPGHTHTLGSHTHTFSATTSGHTHTFSGNDGGHTHTTPASDTKNHTPPFKVIAWVQRVS